MLRAPGGYAIWVGDEAPIERDTCACGHCGRVIIVKPGTVNTVYLITHRDGRVTEEPGAFCRVCMKPVCLRCDDLGVCTPLEKWLEQQEQADRARRSLGV